MTKVADEIKKLFKDRIAALENEKKVNLKVISEWATNWTKRIDKHASDEKQRLERCCTSQKNLLEESRREYEARATTDEMKKNKEKAMQLLDEYKQLEFKLNGDLVGEEDRNGSTMKESEKKIPRGSVENPKTNSGVGNDSAASTNAKPASQSRRSSVTQTSPELSRATSALDKTTTRAGDDGEMDDKCPVCFMIFSQSMNRHDREQHVNDHYADD